MSWVLLYLLQYICNVCMRDVESDYTGKKCTSNRHTLIPARSIIYAVHFNTLLGQQWENKMFFFCVFVEASNHVQSHKDGNPAFHSHPFKQAWRVWCIYHVRVHSSAQDS